MKSRIEKKIVVIELTLYNSSRKYELKDDKEKYKSEKRYQKLNSYPSWDT